jgi:hypothetical protein
MKGKNVYSNSKENRKLIVDNRSKIELLSCQLETQKCKEHLSFINSSYYNAGNFHLEKDYLNSIESLKSAFIKASELKETSCSKCAEFFQLTITHSLENLNEELQKITTGLLRKKRYKKCYLESCKVLHDFKHADHKI